MFHMSMITNPSLDIWCYISLSFRPESNFGQSYYYSRPYARFNFQFSYVQIGQDSTMSVCKKIRNKDLVQLLCVT